MDTQEVIALSDKEVISRCWGHTMSAMKYVTEALRTEIGSADFMYARNLIDVLGSLETARQSLEPMLMPLSDYDDEDGTETREGAQFSAETKIPTHARAPNYDVTLAELGLCVKARNGLASLGARTAGDIIRLGVDGILCSRGMGDKMVTHVGERLAHAGMGWDQTCLRPKRTTE